MTAFSLPTICKRYLIAIGLVSLTLVAGPTCAQLDQAEPEKYPGQIVLDTRGLFTLAAPNSQALDGRTALVQARLNRILLEEPLTPLVQAENGLVLLGKQLLVTVTADDVAKHNTSAPALARSWAASILRALHDGQALATHLEFNSAPDWVSYHGFGYYRTRRYRNQSVGLKSTGYTFKRNLIFVSGPAVEPERVFLREADGNYVVYLRVTAPRSTPSSQSAVQ